MVVSILIINDVFDAINKINKRLSNKIIEISVRQSQFELTFEESTILSVEDIAVLSNMFGEPIDFSDITCFNDRLFVSYRGLEEEFLDDSKVDKGFKDIYRIIFLLKDNICTCPALEYVLSPEYLKVFIDVPNVQLSGLTLVAETLLKQDPFLETGGDRPYLLFINEGGINND